MIKDVYELRSSGSEDPGQSGPAGEQGPRVSVAVISMSRSGESPGISNFPSESESNAVT
jgi:hypothetical protein